MLRKSPGRAAFRLSAIYFIAATLWILVSDAVFLLVFSDDVVVSALFSIIKGLGFVAVTAFAFFELFQLELRRRLELSNALQLREGQLDPIKEQAPLALWVVDDMLRVDMEVAGSIAYKPAPLDEAHGHRLREIFPPECELIKAHQAALQGESRRLKWLLGGRTHDVYITPLFDARQQIVGAIATALDISEREQWEAERMEMEKLRVALEKEKELSELRRNFMSIISHDFRTPLTVIRAQADMVVNYGEKLGEEGRRVELGKIEQQVAHLDRMLDNISLANRSSSGYLRFNPQSTDLGRLCERIIAETRQSIGLHHEFHCQVSDDLGNVQVDEMLFTHILNNLLSNAVKYSAKGSRVSVNFRRRNDEVVCEVRDEGIGIPQDDREHLFDPYHRGENVGQVRGSGLGLKIVQDCVDLHHGRIDFESEEGEGSTFRVCLPVGGPLGD
jgi:signal transduction histidine kinase